MSEQTIPQHPVTRSASSSIPQREALVDLSTLSENAATLARHAGGSELMAVVKADAYGHGLVPAAQALVAGGATRLGAAVIEEALELRRAGITVPLLAWLAAPGSPQEEAIRAGVDLAAYTVEQLADLREAADRAGQPARVHLKIDTGMWRGGSTVDLWPRLVAAARDAQLEGTIEVAGIWSHMACADDPGHPSIDQQLGVFREAVELAESARLHPETRHIANSAATLSLPRSHWDMVRPGIACYGVDPVPPAQRDGHPLLRPAMTLTAAVVQTKRAPAGSGISYGHTHVTERDTTLAVVPLGYADGISRHASSRGSVAIRGQRMPILGRVCMDQLVVDTGDVPVTAGDEVLLFGPGERGEPTAQDWADVTGTIPYEVLTRVAPRVPRRYVQR